MTETDQELFLSEEERATSPSSLPLDDRYTPIGGYKIPRREDVSRIVDRFLPGKLWGHSLRGLIGNPAFALVPILYLNWLSGARFGVLQVLWLIAFLLGFPHANYTALEVRHFLRKGDGIAEARTVPQLLVFGSYFVFGNLLSVYYVDRGAVIMTSALGIDMHLLTLSLALLASVGAVMGLRDVLVADLVARPIWAIQVALSSLYQARWAWLVWLWALTQFAIVEIARHAGIIE